MKSAQTGFVKLQWLVLILICMTPRVIGLALNTEANDDHIEVVERWIATDSYPSADHCWECFQPPIYYSIVYGAAALVGAEDRPELINVAHSLNGLLSLLILSLLYRQIVGFSLSDDWKILLFLFFGLNPKLVAINIQATNDTLVITLGMVSYHLLQQFCRTLSKPTAALLWFSLLAAGMTKGNGLVLVVVCSVIATVSIVARRNLRTAEKIAGCYLFLVLLPVSVGYAGGYVARYEQFADPFRINQEKAPPPNFAYYDGYVGKRMGIRSIVDGYLTFRFLDLLKHPHLGASDSKYEEHRTSFWTLLYAQAFHCQYEQYPPSWRSTSPFAEIVARALYLLSLIHI